MEKEKLREKINQVKAEINELGELRPGAISQQSRSWGKKYWQISYTHRGRSRTGYISDQNYQRARQETENYKRFKELSLELIDLSLEYAKLTDKETESPDGKE